MKKNILTFVSAGLLLFAISACKPAGTEIQVKGNTYIRENIADLSLRSPTMGGRFTVTRVEWVDEDTARVTYEDGHVELVGQTDITITNGVIKASPIRIVNDTNGSSSAGSSVSMSSVSSISSQSSLSSSTSASSLSQGSSAMSQSSASARDRAGVGEFCGGIAGILCEDGLTCDYDGSYPDAGGTCIR